MPDCRSVYITTESSEEAARIGRTLVEERLAACANIISGMHSIYWWEGKVEDGREAILIAKTHVGRLAALTERVKSLHSYDCPCIVSIALNEDEGSDDYLSWIARETGQSG